ncbi:MAG: glycerol-3-phosphate dehydrogenase/oxidase [Phycisphaerales bacterium]|nr:glycerol-3-phosphate dehydrogenase/oxidase [Phycisphaerales bacterium]
MKRDPTSLADREFDLLVIGGGINGTCVARDAALRGLSVALIDRGDFVSVTSSNSLRIIHGGLRYLQHLDFRRMRQSIRERSNWLRLAPHLVHPLSFLAPAAGRGMRSRAAFRAALAVNDLIGWDRNRGLDPARRIPRGRILTRGDALQHYPGADADVITGAALWHDAQMYSSERLVLAVLTGAVEAGAIAVNYIEARRFAVGGSRIERVGVTDRLAGDAFEIRARVVVNASGPVINELLATATGRTTTAARVPLSKAMNILTRRIAGECAVGVAGHHRDPNAAVDHGARLLFITPWRDRSLIGTTHEAYHGFPGAFRPTCDDVQRFVDEINVACPSAMLTLDDVAAVYAGLLPAERSRPGDSDVRLLRHHRLIDHAERDGLDNVISLIGVKFTTARLAAEQVVALACRKLNRAAPACQSACTPVVGGDIPSWDDFLIQEQKRHTGRIEPAVVHEIARLYGTRYPAVLDHLESDSGGAITRRRVIAAQVRYAIRHEMAMTLSDVVCRRTGLSAYGCPSDDELAYMADVMACECDWDGRRANDEIAATRRVFVGWRDEPNESGGQSTASVGAPLRPVGAPAS